MRPDSQEIKVGGFVLSTCGKDSGTVYLVTKTETGSPGYFRVTDGRHHRLDAQKRKNGKHLLPLRVRAYTPDADGPLTNRNIRRAIRTVIDTCINNSIE